MIEQILHLDMTKYENVEDSGSLVAKVQPASPIINRVAEIFEKGLEEEIATIGISDGNSKAIQQSKKQNNDQ